MKREKPLCESASLVCRSKPYVAKPPLCEVRAINAVLEFIAMNLETSGLNGSI